MKRSGNLVFVIPALLGIAAWLFWAGHAPAAPSPSAAETTPDSPSEAVPVKVDHKKLRQVEAEVAQKNREAAQDRQAFLDDGWEMVAVPPPDHRVVAYDPKLIEAGREGELKMQLLSTVPSPDQARRVAEIARRAKNEDTRYAAVESLGRLNAPEATESLYDLLTQGGLKADDPARVQIAPLLHPSALDDPMAAKVALLLDSPSLTSVEKQQIAFTLALLGLRDGMTLDAPISPTARALFDQMTALAKAQFAQAIDRQGGTP